MKKLLLASVFLCTAVITGFAQVGIGTNQPNTSSILDLSSNNKGFLPPRMSTAQRDLISNPSAGMVIYNTTTDCIEFYRSTGWYNACTGGSGPVNPTDSTSNDVAATNLLAHWTFDTNDKEVISSSSAAVTSGATFTNAGRIGNCATLTNGYFVYNPIQNLNKDTALQSYTVSMWVKMPTSDGSHWKSLFQLNSNAYTDVFGIIGVQALNQKTADTLALQIDQTQIDGTGPHTGGFGCGACFSNGLTNPIYYPTGLSWTLLTVTYDGNGTNQNLTVYANGVVIGSQVLTTVKKTPTVETFRVVPTGGNGAGSPATWNNYVTIGTFNWKEFPMFAGTDGYGNSFYTAASRAGYMSNGITGQIDDVRVYNKSLTAYEVTKLYTRGLAGK